MKSFLFILILALFACGTSSNNNSLPLDSSSVTTGTSADSTMGKVEDFSKDTIFTIHFEKGSTAKTVRAKMQGIDRPITVIIPVKQGKVFSATIQPDDSIANVRINQMFSPDGKADGPFGRSLSRSITQQGDYKLIIGENLMQGDEWKGQFLLTVKIE